MDEIEFTKGLDQEAHWEIFIEDCSIDKGLHTAETVSDKFKEKGFVVCRVIIVDDTKDEKSGMKVIVDANKS